MTATKNQQLPHHVAIIMDGNGRWANKRHLPRVAGHKAGVKVLRKSVEHCIARGVGILTVYAFSSENWRRPKEEVSFLMELFMASIKEQVKDLHKNNVMLRFVGDTAAFSPKLQEAINEAEFTTRENTGLNLVIAVNYGGRWDIVTVCRKLAQKVKLGEMDVEDLDEATINGESCLGNLSEPDLFIRTGGEKRISNFLLWQLAYTELYFTDVLWPDFGIQELDKAIEWYADRQRRFGRTSEQVEQARSA